MKDRVILVDVKERVHRADGRASGVVYGEVVPGVYDFIAPSTFTIKMERTKRK